MFVFSLAAAAIMLALPANVGSTTGRRLSFADCRPSFAENSMLLHTTQNEIKVPVASNESISIRKIDQPLIPVIWPVNPFADIAASEIKSDDLMGDLIDLAVDVLRDTDAKVTEMGLALNDMADFVESYRSELYQIEDWLNNLEASD